MSLPAFFHKKITLLVLGIIVLLLYMGFNVWLFRTNVKPSEGTSAVPASQPTSQEILTPTPTPRPTGPGRYACDPNGICGDYGDNERKSCPVTFADRDCLDQCGDKTKWCTQ